jgi:NitT/TauT family transport system ATP-binding protein
VKLADLPAASMVGPVVTAPSDALFLDHVCKVYRGSSGDTEAIKDLSFGVKENEFVAIVGPSGSGKTSLLRIIAGLSPPTSGTVRLHGKPTTGVVDDLILVFQDYARSLCPWLTARRNVALALVRVPIDHEAKRLRVEEAIRGVGLDGFEAHYPWEMSGGMQQRLQIARAIAYRSKILLMDEPFGSLDALTRFELEDGLLALWQSSPKTIVFVTHDIDEAVYLADRVIVVSRRPARVLAEFAVALPRPRHQIETRGLPEFAALRGGILRLIGSVP